MYTKTDQPRSKGSDPRGKLAILAIALFTAMGMAGLTAVGAQSVSLELAIHAKALDDHDCDDTEWQFVITQIDDEADAPASINVTWANGTQADVELSKFTGKTAHYSTTLELNSTVTSATTDIYAEWDGQFNLGHGPCDGGNGGDAVPCPKLTVTAEAGPANHLSWTAVDDADDYKVYRATDGETFTLLATVDGGTLAYEDSDVEQGQTVQYMVTAMVDGQESEGCDHVEVTTIPLFSTAFAAVAAGMLGIGGYAMIRRRT